MFKRHICKSKFHVCCQFFRYKNPRRKYFLNPSCPKHPKIIEIKNDIIFCFYTFLWCLKKVLRRPKGKSNICHCHFPSSVGIGMTRIKTVFLVVELPTYAISVSLTLESLLAHYCHLFSARNLGILFIIIVL